MESEITTKRGAKRNVLITSELITIRERQLIIASVIDITERRQAEEKLRQSEELFSRAFHVSPAANTITRVGDGQFIDVNETFLRTFEFSREETIGHTSTELNMLSLEERAKLIQAQREAGGLRNAELQARSKSGRLIHLLFSSAPIDVDGEAGLISTLIDITGRKQAEARILRINRLYATLSQINQTIVRARDRDTLFQEICRVAIEFGQFRMAWIGWIDEAEQRIKPIVFAGEEQGYLTEVTVKFRPQDSGRGPTGLAALEGHCVIFSNIASDPRTEPWRQPAQQRGYGSSAAVPIRQNNEVVGALTVYASEPDGFDTDDERLLDEIGLDISFALDMLEQDTQRRRAEDALQSLNLELEQRVVRRTAELAAANERLTELDRLKSKFVSTVTHELRTPVTSLGLQVDLLEHGKPEKREQYLVRLREQMTRLQTTINDILDLSRLERDAIEADWAMVEINPMVEHVVAVQRVAAEAAGLQLSSEVPAHPVLVRARPEHLLRAITNLISNAVKYTPAGAVNVITYTEADRICVQIKDTGLGIAPEDLSHLFERFYRGKQAAQSSIPGTGLGLSIVKEIAEVHGGTVEVDSTLGVGSTFRLWLPLAVIG